MILDYIENYKEYGKTLSNFIEGFEFAMSLKNHKVGKYELNDDIFAMVQEGVTSNIKEGSFESHKDYVDVQIVLEGEEIVEWQVLSELKESIPYNDVKDTMFSEGAGETFTVRKNMFYILFPQDGHKPCRYSDVPSIYKKIVLKLKIK